MKNLGHWQNRVLGQIAKHPGLDRKRAVGRTELGDQRSAVGQAHAIDLSDTAAGKRRQLDRVDAEGGGDALARAERIVLPGVGSFRACAEGLRAEAGVIEAMRERVFVGGAPFLGICVGMQLLATRGLEHGETPGLGWIDGTVRLIEPIDDSVKVPHMGWNDVAPLPHAHDHEVLVGGEAYFLHSYHFKLRHHEDVLAMTDHGGGLVAAVGRDNFLGYRLPLVNKIQTEQGEEETADGLCHVPRLFRNAPGLHFVGRVHEQIYSSVLLRQGDWQMFVISFHDESESQVSAALEKEIRRLLFGFRLNQESVVRESLDELRAVKISTALFITKKNAFLVAFVLREDLQSQAAGKVVKEF